MLRVALIAMFSLALAACNQQQPPADTAETSAPADAPMKKEGPVAKAPSAYGIGTTFVGNLTVNGDTTVSTDTMVQKIERDGRILDVYEHATPSSDPGGACDGETHVLWDSQTQNWAGCMANGEILGENKPYAARFEWPLQVGNRWRSQPRWEDRVLHPDWSGEYWSDYEVLAYEEVTVPAGRYMAFKVGTIRTQHDDWYEVSWYSPQVGAVVKAEWGRTEDNGYGPLEGSWELVRAEFR